MNFLEDEETKFCTGSSYRGSFNEFGMMEGYGIYKFRDGSVYRGDFKNGEFYGEGTITLPSFFKLQGNFINGKCENFKMEFADGAPYEYKDWKYCQYPDRRFYKCVEDGIPPIGEISVTERGPPGNIPSGHYDTEEGYYDPKSGYIMCKSNPNLLLRFPSQKEKRWILQHCRHTNDDPVGYQQDIIDENVLALQELFDEEESSECHCFESESKTSSSLSSLKLDVELSSSSDSTSIIEFGEGNASQIEDSEIEDKFEDTGSVASSNEI